MSKSTESKGSMDTTGVDLSFYIMLKTAIAQKGSDYLLLLQQVLQFHRTMLSCDYDMINEILLILIIILKLSFFETLKCN
ncbi:hypothetical protein BpHYR1_030284 [Brachionus plicatilis]|uniref:Uncharacterized protein n=1 Tax=Brachionus plicatilis TaxID=10195 RepID=A0A3M7SQE3_BRAPC|nr:hypothetical protein BpHYR1_030284 [Brachionus plicatilis]